MADNIIPQCPKCADTRFVIRIVRPETNPPSHGWRPTFEAVVCVGCHGIVGVLPAATSSKG